MILTFCLWHLLRINAPSEVYEVNIYAVRLQLLCHSRAYTVHYGVAFGVHIAERTAQKDLDVLCL